MIVEPATDSPKPSKPAPDSKRDSAPLRDTPAVFNGGPARRDETADETPPREQRVVFYSARFGLHREERDRMGSGVSSPQFISVGTRRRRKPIRAQLSGGFRRRTHTLAVIRVC